MIMYVKESIYTHKNVLKISKGAKVIIIKTQHNMILVYDEHGNKMFINENKLQKTPIE
jgi:uncharacterized protein YgiM (DUF1202 family)